MRIVILDGEGLNPGDLDWSPISSLGETEIYPKTPEEKIEERSVQADILVTNKTPLTGDTIGRLKKLRMIATLSTGYNVVDVQAAAERGIPVANVPAYCTRAVAQMAFALLFELTNRVSLHARAVREGEWCASPNFCFWKARCRKFQRHRGNQPQQTPESRTGRTGRKTGRVACSGISRRPGFAVARL